jgi:hypothetical protein
MAWHSEGKGGAASSHVDVRRAAKLGHFRELLKNPLDQAIHYFGGESSSSRLLGIGPLGHNSIYRAVNHAAAQFIQNLGPRRRGRGALKIGLELTLQIVDRFAGAGWPYRLRLSNPGAGVRRQPGLQIFNNRTRPGRRVDDRRCRLGRWLPG